MSFPDEVTLLSFELLTDLPLSSIEVLAQAFKKEPMVVKKRLAFEISKIHHGQRAAQKAQEEFERIFQKKMLPTAIRSKKMLRGNYSLASLVFYSGSTSSKSQAKRLIKEGGAKINGKTIRDPQFKIQIQTDKKILLKIGKLKYLKIEGVKG